MDPVAPKPALITLSELASLPADDPRREELVAWRELAISRGLLLADLSCGSSTVPAQRRATRACARLEKLGINPNTGKPLPKPKGPKPKKKASR